MTPNDAQIDLLLRAYSRKAGASATDDDGSGGRSSTHLDADELSAFADGALPPATSARYVSHLADCEDCRKLATQLTMAATSTVPLRVEAATQISEPASSWQRFKDLFAVPNLRYAAFAMVVIAAVGITFVALRRQSESNLEAQRAVVPSSENSAVKSAPEAVAPAAPSEDRQTASESPATFDNSAKAKSLETSAAPPPPPLKETDMAKNAPVASKRAESEVAERAPSYAPPPPGERAEPTSVAGSDLKAGVARAQPAQPKKADDEFRATDRARAEEISRARQMDVDQNRARKGGPSRAEVQNKANTVNQQAPAAPNRETRDKSGETQGQSRTQGLIVNSESAAPEERKTGGRSFRRQGGAWVDKKFKSSMSVTDIKRGSEEFRALDSDLRSIAGQLSGEIVVVWKSKAYRIH